MSLIRPFARILSCGPLIVSALVLAGVSFFWQASMYQGMLNRIDSELLLTARTIAYFHQSGQQDDMATTQLCDSIRPLLELSSISVQVAIYSAEGGLVCLTDPGTEDQRIPLELNIPTIQTSIFSFTSSHGNTRRSLLQPVAETNGVSHYLAISAGMDPLTRPLHQWRLLLLLGSILILATVAFYLRRQRSRQSEEITDLAELINRTGPDHPPQAFTPASSHYSPELYLLGSSYNQMTERMYSALQKTRQFAANVAHELRTPLTILRGETEIALRSKRDLGEARQILESSLEEINRMSFLIDDLLMLSKSDLGEIPLQPGPIQLVAFLKDLQRQVQILANNRNITVALQAPADEIVIRADELRLRQAFLNLLTNAVRYTQEQGNIMITLKSFAEQVEISIADNGIGIDEHHLKHIFDRFYRVDKKNHQYDGGTGLGLAIVKWVIDAHRGSIRVASTLGQGSNFTVTLPHIQN